MKIAILGDTHFGMRNDSIPFLNYSEKFYRDTFFPKLKENNIKTIVQLGDIFDRRKYINFHTLKRAKEMFFNVCEKQLIDLYVLAGNHDTFWKNTNDINSPDLLLREYENIRVIDTPQTIHLDYADVDSDVCIIPWMCADNYERSMEEMKNTSATLCMGHFEIEGFQTYRGMYSEEGLHRDIFRKFDYTFSGHYHHRSNADGIYYVGTPYEITWQDYNDLKGFHIFDLETRKLEFIGNPNKMFHKIVYNDKEESIIDINNKNLSEYTNTYVKVVVINKTNPYLFDKFMANLYNVNPVDITIAEDFTDLTEDVETDTVDQAEDTLTILRKYVDNITEDKLDTKKLQTIISELYVEALNSEQ